MRAKSSTLLSQRPNNIVKTSPKRLTSLITRLSSTSKVKIMQYRIGSCIGKSCWLGSWWLGQRRNRCRSGTWLPEQKDNRQEVWSRCHQHSCWWKERIERKERGRRSRGKRTKRRAKGSWGGRQQCEAEQCFFWKLVPLDQGREMMFDSLN